MRRPTRAVLGVLTAGAVALTAAACGGSGGGSSSGGKTIKVAYQKFGAFTQMDKLMHTVKGEYEKAHPGWTVQLEPIQADENSYYTKLDLMSRSASTAPDVLYEDTFLVNADISAGFLAPIDSYVAKWKDWSQFTPASKTAGQGQDGKTYGVPMGTD